MNRPKRVFFTWDERLIAFNTYEEGASYIWNKYGVTLQDIPEGWRGIDKDGIERFLFSTIVHYNDGRMVYE